MKTPSTEIPNKKTQRDFQRSEAFANETDKPAVVTIGKGRDEVYDFLSDFANFPKFSKDVLSVTVDDKKSQWTVRAANKTEILSAELTRELRGKSLEWIMSHEDGSSDLCSANFFDDARGGCVVTLRFGHQQETGKISGIIDFFTGKASKSQAKVTLRRLKALLETGEIATIVGQSSGREEISH